ncbi:MAG: pitrilysin family protein [Gemmatimonadota bacterium]
MPSSSKPLDRSSPPAPGPIRPFHLPDLHVDVLGNRLRVRSLFRGEVPLVSVAVVLDAGEVRIAEGLEGLAVLTGDSIQGGTEHRTGVELAEDLERLGTELRVSTGWDATTVAFTCVAERVDEVLGLAAEVLRQPSFPDQEVARVRQQRLAAIRQRSQEPDQLADDHLAREVFSAGHPYHRPLAGEEDSVTTLGPRETREFAEGHYQADRAGIVLVGDLGAARVLELAERHFGDWNPGDFKAEAVPRPDWAEARSLLVVDRPGSVQSEIRIGHPAPSRGHPDEIPLRVGNTVLGGAFTSRLNLSLREEHGFTYGVHSRLSFRRSGGLARISTAVQTEVTAAALGEATRVFEAFASEGPTPEELERARDYMAGVFPLRMETTAQLASRVAELLVYQLPDDYHHRYRERIRAVDGERVRVAVREHLRPERASIVVVGDAARVVPEIEALGLGAVRVREP